MTKYVYFMGSDGCGKTTYINKLSQKLISEGNSVQYYWIRSPKIFSKPLMLYCRIAGYTKYFYVDGVRYGSHDFEKSKFVSYLYPILQLLDFILRYWLDSRKMKSFKVDYIIFDRHAYDTLADIMVDTKRFALHKSIIGKAFFSLIPKDVIIFPLHVDPIIIKQRKVDTLHDPNILIKEKVYKTLYNSMSLNIIDNSTDDENIVFNSILALLGLEE